MDWKKLCETGDHVENYLVRIIIRYKLGLCLYYLLALKMFEKKLEKVWTSLIKNEDNAGIATGDSVYGRRDVGQFVINISLAVRVFWLSSRRYRFLQLIDTKWYENATMYRPLWNVIWPVPGARLYPAHLTFFLSFSKISASGNCLNSTLRLISSFTFFIS